LGGIGAATGIALDPEHPIAAGATGAFAGALLPSALSKLPAALSKMATTAGQNEVVKEVFKFAPTWQRFSLLADAEGLAANAVAAPWGSGIMASIERAFNGDPRGMTALKLLSDIPSYLKGLKANWQEAAQSIGRAEGHALGINPTATEKALSAPGTFMTSGDVTARNILMSAGFSEEEARRFTLTNEPELLKAVADFNKGKKGNPLLDLLFPFRRTPANIWEQGGYRTPIVGEILQRMRAVPDPFKERMIQQGLGAASGLAAGAASAQMDPVTAKHFRRFASNLGGMYSLPVSAGVMAGQAYRAGKPVLPAAAAATIQGLPLPAAQPLTDIKNFIFGTAKGEHPLPSGLVPAYLRKTDPLEALIGAVVPSPFDQFIPAGQQGFDWRGPK
jgi:hypothetical protein